MEFGKISNFAKVDFSLPEEPSINRQVLSKKKSSFTFFLGAPVWGNKNFVGKIYPCKTKPTNYLEEYSKHFNCIELNSTHYHLPSINLVKKWREVTASDFKFCPKFPQSISHCGYNFSKLQDDIQQFLERMELLDNKLGDYFFQLPPHFAPDSWPILKEFIDQFKLQNLFIEFRHPGWFLPESRLEKIYEYLQISNVGIVITDVAGRRDVLHMRLTCPKVFIRFTGNSLHRSDFERLNQWGEKILNWREKGLEHCYFILHQPDESQCVELALHLGKRLGFPMKLPSLLLEETQEQLSLF